jgi:hypothetical protein
VPSGVIGGLLAALLAGIAEVLIFTGLDWPRTEAQRSLRIIAAAFVGGQAMLGLVIATLSASIKNAAIPIPVAFASAALIGVGAFTIAVAYRRAAVAPTSGDTARDRAQLVTRMGIGEAIGVVGAVLAILSLFVSTP